MRVYINEQEARVIKTCILNEMEFLDKTVQRIAYIILERIDLCIKLQTNEKRSK